MQNKIITEKQDPTYLKWSHARNASGTAGTFLKAQSTINRKNMGNDLYEVELL